MLASSSTLAFVMPERATAAEPLVEVGFEAGVSGKSPGAPVVFPGPSGALQPVAVFLLASRSLVPSLVMMRRQQLLWACVFVALILAAASAAAEGGFRRYLRLSQDVKSLKERNKRLGDDNVRLRREVEALRDDPRALERAAREELGLVKPGEIVFSLEGS